MNQFFILPWGTDMQMIYSAANNSFFAKNDVEKYESAGWDLSDVVDVTYDTYLEFIEDRTLKGQMRIAGDDGLPAWGDIPPPTAEQLIASAEQEKQSRLAHANAVIADWRTDLLLGTINDEDKEKLVVWMRYIKDVKAVDTSTVPKWPVLPE